jgi:hypothetical protein
MSCPNPGRMELYLEGALPAPERAEFERHLDACPACRLELEDRRLLGQALASLPPIDVPEGFAEAVMARIPRARRTGLGWVSATVVGIGVVLAMLLAYHLASGESLAEVLGAVGRAVAGVFGLLVPLAAKAFMLGRVLIELIKDVGAALLRGLGILSPLIRPELIGAILILGSALFLVAILGLRKIVSLGERP